MKDRACEIAVNSKCDEYQRWFASMVYNCFDKNTGSGVASKVGANVNKVLAQELHKPAVRKIQKKESVCKVLR